MPECCNPNGMTDAEFANFCELKTEEGAIPAGKIEYVSGKIMFRSGAGLLLTVKDYKKKYGFDPEPVWARIKEYQRSTGQLHDIHEVSYINPKSKMAPVS